MFKRAVGLAMVARKHFFIGAAWWVGVYAVLAGGWRILDGIRQPCVSEYLDAWVGVRYGACSKSGELRKYKILKFFRSHKLRSPMV